MAQVMSRNFIDEINAEIPRDAFPTAGMDARAAEAVVEGELFTDCNPALNLSSFVTTFAEQEAINIGRNHFHTNFIDHDMYPRAAEIEGRIVRWLHGLWHGPRAQTSTARRPSARPRRACWPVWR